MRPKERRESGEQDLFRSRLDQIIDLDHALVKLARAIDWGFLEEKFGAAYTDKPGHPPLPTRLMAGLAILKHSYDLSDEGLCERWVENPYFQYFCGEEFFQHRLVFDRSSLTRWRQRMGEEKLVALIQESLAVAARTEALRPKDLARVVVDTTVQPKAVMFPTDARLIDRARTRLVRLAKKHGIELRQSYARVGKFALIKHQRYAHAKQFKRAKRALRKLKTYLGRVMRDIARKTAGDGSLRAAFVRELYLAERVLTQERRRRDRKRMPLDRAPRVYSLHAPEVECIGKGKAHKPYEFGVKASIATTVAPSAGGQFVTHAMALPGNPYDGHTLAAVIPGIEALLGNVLARIVADAGYRGHNASPEYRFRVYTAGQKRGVTEAIKRDMRRRAAIEPVIGHLKDDHRMGRCHLAHASGDAINVVLAAVGYNFRRLIRWLRLLLLVFLAALTPAFRLKPT
ncbi:MAG: IS5 family transposase [Xanthobacteraceae bacterium]